MSEEPKSVFSELDKQTEKIDNISEKLEGVSVNDLYALAKRTWEYGDYQTAQKYYNYISLLKPLDWEAPLYATLCNFKGYHDMFFWTKVPEQVERTFVSTIRYINSIDLKKEDKELEMTRCIEVIEEFMTKTNNHYFKYANEYNDTNPNYIFELQEWYVSIINQIKEIELNAIKPFIVFLADSCLSIIKETGLIATNIEQGQFNYLKSVASKDWEIDYEILLNKRKEANNLKSTYLSNLALQEKNEIMLKGKLYYQYNDKIIAKRVVIKRLILSSLVLLSSIVGNIIAVKTSMLATIIFSLSILLSVFIAVRTIIDRNLVCCSSFLSIRRKKCRLTSNNTVVKESKFGFVILLATIIVCFASVCGAVLVVILLLDKEATSTHKIVFCTCIAIDVLAQYVLLLTFPSEVSYNGTYKYLYKGKYYSEK